MRTNLSKAEAIALYGSVTKLARAIGRTHSAVSMWNDDAPIPNEHYLALRYQLRPDAFDEQGDLRSDVFGVEPAAGPADDSDPDAARIVPVEEA